MKLIAKTDNGFLADLTANEVAMILGFRSAYDDNYKKAQIKIGADIPVNRIKSTAEFVRTMEESRLKNLRQSLENAITDINNASDTVNKLKLFDALKKEED